MAFQFVVQNLTAKILVAVATLSLTVLFSAARAADEPFVGPSNWGVTGLMEVPTARTMSDNSFRFGAAQVKPYRYYYGSLGLFDRLEFNGRVTEVLGVKALLSGYGNTKDKAVDFKYQFHREGKYSPALSLGIMDPHGTRLYSSQFLVASKQIYPFDFTLGFGNGRFGKRPLASSGEGFDVEMFTDPIQWLKDAQPFWGIQFSPSPKYSFMVEYNPTQYDKQTSDPAQPKYFRKPVPLNYNFGFRYKPVKWAELALSFQRGNEIGLSVSAAFDIGSPLIPIYDKPYQEKATYALLTSSERIAIALKEQGFSDIGIEETGETLIIRAENDKWFYSMRALGMILRTLKQLAPPAIDEARITLTSNGIPLFRAVVNRHDLDDLYDGKMTNGEFFHLTAINTDLKNAPDIRRIGTRKLVPGWKPSFQTFLNDPSGFFKFRLGAQGWLSYQPWTGASFLASLEGYAFNNISSSNIPPSEAVRSDYVEYRRQTVGLERLMVNQVYKPTPSLYTRFAGGLLETEYAGIDGEVAMPFANGRLFLGLEASLVKKRDPDNAFALKDDDARSYYDVAFLNARINFPKQEMNFDIKTGRFLGGDFGTRVTFVKHVKGVDLYAWYTVTDTSVFKSSPNKGYHDKGIGVSIPLRLFTGKDTRTAYNFGLSPWTRDTGQDLDRHQELFDVMGRDVKAYLLKDRKLIEQ